MSEASTVTAIQHSRANRVVIENQFGTNPVIYFEQESVIEVGDQTFRQQLAPIHRTLTSETANTSFEVFDQITKVSLGHFTYWDFSNIVRSLFEDTGVRVAAEQTAADAEVVARLAEIKLQEDTRTAEEVARKEASDAAYAVLMGGIQLP